MVQTWTCHFGQQTCIFSASVVEDEGKSFTRVCSQPVSPLTAFGNGGKRNGYPRTLSIKGSSVSPCNQNFPVCFVCIKPANWDNSMFSTSFLGILDKGLKLSKECRLLCSECLAKTGKGQGLWEILHQSLALTVQHEILRLSSPSLCRWQPPPPVPKHLHLL